MGLSETEIDKLLKLVASSQEDQLDCDGCLERIAEFADANLANRTVPEAADIVATHLQSCKCCADEYHALLEGLRALEGKTDKP